jgi:hypothetical protein
MRCCRKTLQWRQVIHTTLAAAAGLPPGQQSAVGQRLSRHMVALALPPPSDGVLRAICSAVLGGWLSAHFTPDVASHVLRPLVDGCVEVHSAACASLLPAPSHMHYTFSLRDVARVLQGVLSLSPAACGANVPAALTRVWVHETQRVYGDRLVCAADQAVLHEQLLQLLVARFGWRAEAAEDAALQPAAASAASASPTFFAAGAAGSLAAGSRAACVASRALLEGTEQLLFGDFARALGQRRQERGSYDVLPPLDVLASLSWQPSRRERARRTGRSRRCCSQAAQQRRWRQWPRACCGCAGGCACRRRRTGHAARVLPGCSAARCAAGAGAAAAQVRGAALAAAGSAVERQDTAVQSRSLTGGLPRARHLVAAGAARCCWALAAAASRA